MMSLSSSGASDGPTGRDPALIMPVTGLLDNIRSAWNVGSMFRTADAAGLAGLYLAGMTCTPPRADLEKTALGATASVPWDYFSDAVAAARRIRAEGRSLIVLEQTPEACGWEDYTVPFPCCFVVGHEVHGVNPDVIALADQVLEIPMAGIKKSLNVAVSFGVLAYAIRRQWEAAGRPGACRG